jgi:hypothetical protein
MKIIIIVAILSILVGCGNKQIRIRSEIQEVQVPLLYCPAPPTTNQPILPIHEMSPDQLNDNGEIVKYYKASMLVLLGYIEELETSLQSYDATNEAYDELRKQFWSDWNEQSQESRAKQ